MEIVRKHLDRERKDAPLGRRIGNCIILEVGSGAAAPFRPKESLVFWVEEEVQSYLVLEEVHRTFERVFSTRRGKEKQGVRSGERGIIIHISMIDWKSQDD